MIKDMIEKPVHFTKTRPVRVLYGHCLDNRNHPAVRMVHQIAAELSKLGCVVQVHEPEQATPDFIVQPSGTARIAVKSSKVCGTSFGLRKRSCMIDLH